MKAAGSVRPGKRWKCKLCQRWRFQTWWSIYQHFRKVHPQVPKKDILKNSVCFS